MPKHRKLLFLIIISLPVLAMLLLARWNYIQADDYMCHWLRLKHGFWGMQHWIYLNNTGRYTSSFLAAMASEGDVIFRAPWLFPVLMIIAEILALFIFCTTIFNRKTLDALILATGLFIVHMNIIPEPSTAMYWFSGAATYQVSIILFFLLAASMFRLSEKGTMGSLMISSLLILLIGGTNEVSALIMELSVIAVVWYLYQKQTIPGNKAAVLMLSASFALLILFIAPGIHIRRSYMPGPELMVTIPATVSWLLFSVWNLVIEPSFWLVALTIFYFSNSGMLQVRVSKQLIILLATIQIISLFVVLFGTHGSIPLRAMNVYTSMNALLLFLITGWLGSHISPMFSADAQRIVRMLAPVAAAILLFSGLSGSLFQSFLSAPFAKTIQQNWISSIGAASKQEKKYVALPSYQESADSLVDKSHLKIVMKDLARRPPELLQYHYNKSNEITFCHLIVRNKIDSLRVGAEFFVWPEWATPTSR